jgi:BirA family biotin operon repressor/biotin-[acetyl-CoA-carboxylase] ligase
MRFTSVVRLAEVDSTNRVALAEARRGAPEGLVVVADHQHAGRGRRGRRWVSPPGASLLCSVLFRPPLRREELHLVPSALSLAALDAVEATSGLRASLKWPNDLVAGPRKLGGVLAELAEGVPVAVVVGIGVNLAWPAGGPPSGGELARELAGATTLEAETGRAVAPGTLLDALLAALERRYETLLAPQGVAATAAAYEAACATLGQRVRVELEGEVLLGRAVRLAPDGRLVVALEGGGERRLEVGDVVHLGRAEPD